MPRVIYYVTPSNGKWQIIKGGAKRSSFVFLSKLLAIKKASDLAKSNKLAQVVIHGRDGKIISDRMYEKRDFKKKKKIKETVRKSKITKKKNIQKAYKKTAKRRKAAVLGIDRKYRKKLEFRKSVRLGIAKAKKSSIAN